MFSVVQVKAPRGRDSPGDRAETPPVRSSPEGVRNGDRLRRELGLDADEDTNLKEVGSSRKRQADPSVL